MEDFPELISRLCVEKFESLPHGGKPNSNEWTVLSCIVLEKYSTFEVVALGTGSKCIGRNKMSYTGDILNDSHAEVVCRRAFIAYLYKQINHSTSFDIELFDSIFFLNSKSKKFKLKEEIKFHFFSTMMPCGDASIFPKCEYNAGDVLNNDVEQLHDSLEVCEEIPSKKLKIDVHRTGAKCLKIDKEQDPKRNGVDYHITGVVRTKPGRGDPTLSVSCSDKITKWCHLGIQGALLSIFLEEPIYLSTFTVAGNVPFSEESLKRSCFDRITDLNFKKPFGQTLLKFYHAKSIQFKFHKVEGKEVSPSSIIWYHAKNEKPEVAVGGKKQGVTKKNQNSKSSRLKVCKAEFLNSFKSIYKLSHFNIDAFSYLKCKKLAFDYQENWDILKKSFRVWPKKSEVLLEFQ